MCTKEWIRIFKYEKEQTIIKIGDIEVGGQPGEHPTVLIGTLFYQGQKILEDPKKGIFNKTKAEELINEQEKLSDKTGNPHMVDVVGETPEALIRALDFVANISKAPLLIDGIDQKIRLAGAKHVMEVGLGERGIYNTLGADVTEEEITGIQEVGIKSGVILTYSLRHIFPQDKVKLLLGTEKNQGLLNTARRAGLENVLVDTAVIDMPGVALAAEAVYWIKKEIGIPAGCAATNAIDCWSRLKVFPLGSNVCYSGINIIAQTLGADFLFYGAIERAPLVFPACAMTDALIAYRNRTMKNIQPKSKEHPLYKIF